MLAPIHDKVLRVPVIIVYITIKIMLVFKTYIVRVDAAHVVHNINKETY